MLLKSTLLNKRAFANRKVVCKEAQDIKMEKELPQKFVCDFCQVESKQYIRNQTYL